MAAMQYVMSFSEKIEALWVVSEPELAEEADNGNLTFVFSFRVDRVGLSQ